MELVNENTRSYTIPMLTNKQLVSIKMRDLISLTGDVNRNSVSSMRYDDLFKLCGLDELDFL